MYMVMMMQISYYSLGCKVNLYECEAIIQTFLQHDFELVDFHEPADVVLINTCSITEVSDAKSRKIIRQAIRISPNAVIAVMGCYAQLNPSQVTQIPGVDIVIGTQYRHQLFDMVMDVLKTREAITRVTELPRLSGYEELKVSRYTDKTRGFVKIEDGCDNFCSYCTIPYARGRVRSRLPLDVLNEIKTLTEEGTKELVLTGINTGCYGHDLEHYSLTSLLKEMIKIPNLGRLRISSVELTEVSDELIVLIKDHPDHFCHHLHIPLQGGANPTLKRMNRKYTMEDYLNRIQAIREQIPMINITTDVMVGFSGESDEDFLETLHNIKCCAFGEMHVFPYSRRPLTRAYQFDGIVPEVVKQQRVKQILELNESLALSYREAFMSQTIEVLVEKCENGILFGHTSHYLEVEAEGEVAPNTIVKVKITKIGYPISKGELL